MTRDNANAAVTRGIEAATAPIVCSRSVKDGFFGDGIAETVEKMYQNPQKLDHDKCQAISVDFVALLGKRTHVQDSIFK